LILEEKQRRRARYLQFKFHNIRRSILESAIGRGDRRCADAIEAAWRAARFDLWDECFHYETWRDAFAACGLDLKGRARQGFDPDQILPWEHLGGPDKDYLLTHLANTQENLRRQ